MQRANATTLNGEWVGCSCGLASGVGGVAEVAAQCRVLVVVVKRRNGEGVVLFRSSLVVGGDGSAGGC